MKSDELGPRRAFSHKSEASTAISNTQFGSPIGLTNEDTIYEEVSKSSRDSRNLNNSNANSQDGYAQKEKLDSMSVGDVPADGTSSWQYHFWERQTSVARCMNKIF